MNRKKLTLCLAGLLVTAILVAPVAVQAEEPKGFIPDKALCEKMLRHGKEAYQRGKYLDAKEYFRKAVQADPSSQVAWRYYDMAAVFALAERVEQNTDLIMPGASKREEMSSGTPSSAPSPPPAAAPAPAKQTGGFKIVGDEGC